MSYMYIYVVVLTLVVLLAHLDMTRGSCRYTPKERNNAYVISTSVTYSNNICIYINISVSYICRGRGRCLQICRCGRAAGGTYCRRGSRALQ